MLQEGVERYEKRDFKEALGFLERSCIVEGGYGCDLTAYLYASGKGGVGVSHSKALKALEYACNYGNVKMCHIVYKAYENIGLHQEAIAMQERACKGGDFGACFELSKEYFWGKNVAKDFEQSLDLAYKSCYGGSSKGCSIAIAFCENSTHYPFLKSKDICHKSDLLRAKREENIKNSRVLEAF